MNDYLLNTGILHVKYLPSSSHTVGCIYTFDIKFIRKPMKQNIMKKISDKYILTAKYILESFISRITNVKQDL